MTIRGAAIEGSEAQVLHSELTGKEYLISVGLPYGYYDEPEKKWPVVYLLDSYLFFGTVTELVRTMAFCGSTSDAIVVGIGYATETQMKEAFDERHCMRYQDLTPVRDEESDKSYQENTGREVESGGAGKFLEWITTEVIPLVEGTYRVDANDRTLAGHSHGGLFTLYAMFQDPGRFKNYIASSPSMGWKEQIMLEVEKGFASENSVLPASLFLSMGELEKDYWEDSFDGMLRLFDQMESRGYEQFEIWKQIYADEDHCTVWALGLQAGLKSALRIE